MDKGAQFNVARCDDLSVRCSNATPPIIVQDLDPLEQEVEIIFGRGPKRPLLTYLLLQSIHRRLGELNAKIGHRVVGGDFIELLLICISHVQFCI